ncbi:MAG TPA: nitroreductase [Thiotrichaceae bacterium]|jgi:nitroreductase|nr:nitroreductase [Thiotrichaceae bacterium]HIM06964.1 nitroreductase [Gammaproteobacteria bacterium]
MFNKKIETKTTINELIASRWSGRAYDAEKLVAREDIVSLMEAARWAPSCFGDQPWRFIVFDKATNVSAWEKAMSCLVAGNLSWAKYAPLLFLACADSKVSKNGSPNRWGQYDTGAASENLCLQAASLGLMVHQMGGFDVDMTREAFEIPEQYELMAMMTVGYQLAESDIPEDMKEREYNERARNSLGDNFFDGNWNTPI